MVPEVSEEFVRGKCNFFAACQVWPLKKRLDPEGWLGNFSQSDRRMAVQLLNGFMYFSDDFLDRMFVSAVQGLSRITTSLNSTLAIRRAEWFAFLDEAVFTFPTGETPFPGDSGHLFVRRARDLLGIDEHNVLSPEAALERVLSKRANKVVFVDDFVGTGQQFLKTWRRVSTKLGLAFSTVPKDIDFDAYYCPVFCTEFSRENQLASLVAGKVTLAPAHWLRPEHSVFDPESLWWPEKMRSEVHDFVRRYSLQIGLPDTDGYDTRDWQGYNRLGLAISFPHCCPDATIPLFDTTMSGWRPLWKR